MTRKLSKKLAKTQRTLRRSFRKKPTKIVISAVLLLFLLVVARVLFMPNKVIIVPASYQPLLSTIAEGESKGNYNAYYGSPDNSTVVFTQMPIKDVLAWQEQYVAQGSPSNAVGKYQIIQPTLRGLIEQLGIDQNALFDEAMQDRMAVTLLERRGVLDYVDNKITREQFAANIAKEWAALPKTIGENPEQSYYAGDGLNAARVDTTQVFESLSKLQKM